MNVVREVNANDVLLGRGTGPNDHPGNVFFRNLINKLHEEYQQVQFRGDKAKVARKVVDLIHSQKGRFLRKLDPKEIEACHHQSNEEDSLGGDAADEQEKSPGSAAEVLGAYLVIDDDKVLVLKTKQAFQHFLRTIPAKHQQQSQKSPSPSRFAAYRDPPSSPFKLQMATTTNQRASHDTPESSHPNTAFKAALEEGALVQQLLERSYTRQQQQRQEALNALQLRRQLLSSNVSNAPLSIAAAAAAAIPNPMEGITSINAINMAFVRKHQAKINNSLLQEMRSAHSILRQQAIRGSWLDTVPAATMVPSFIPSDFGVPRISSTFSRNLQLGFAGANALENITGESAETALLRSEFLRSTLLSQDLNTRDRELFNYNNNAHGSMLHPTAEIVANQVIASLAARREAGR